MARNACLLHAVQAYTPITRAVYPARLTQWTLPHENAPLRAAQPFHHPCVYLHSAHRFDIQTHFIVFTVYIVPLSFHLQ